MQEIKTERGACIYINAQGFILHNVRQILYMMGKSACMGFGRHKPYPIVDQLLENAIVRTVVGGQAISTGAFAPP